MANRKVAGPVDLPVELIKLFFDGVQSLLHDFHAITAATSRGACVDIEQLDCKPAQIPFARTWRRRSSGVYLPG